MNNVFLGVIIPTYMERDNIVNLLENLQNTLSNSNIDYRILVVDDNSPDGTADVVKKYVKAGGRVSLLVREGKRGLGSAIMDGFRIMIEDTRVTHLATMDADGSHRPEDLVKMLMKVNEADLVQGSRYVTGGSIIGWGFHRRLISRFANLIARVFFGSDIRDYTSNFRIYSRELVGKLIGYELDDSYDWVVESMVLAKTLGFKVVEVPIVFINREKGRSKLGLLEIIKWFINIIKIKSRVKRFVNRGGNGY